MNKISRVIVSLLVSLAAALTAAVALSAPAQAMTVGENTNTNPLNQVVSVTLSDADAAKVAVGWYWAEALCTDTSDGVISTSSSWFKWDAPTPEQAGRRGPLRVGPVRLREGGRPVGDLHQLPRPAGLVDVLGSDTCYR